MASLKNFFTFLTLALFSVSVAAPVASDDVNLVDLNPDEQYVQVFGRGSINSGYCGSQLTTLCNTIDSDVDNIVANIDKVIDAITSATSCQCELDQDIQDLLQSIEQLIIDLVSKIALINWSCVTISLCFTLGNLFCSLINCCIKFCLCVLSWAVKVGFNLDVAIWKIIINIPVAIVHCLEEICDSVLVFKLIVSVVLNHIKTCIRLLFPHCGFTVDL